MEFVNKIELKGQVKFAKWDGEKHKWSFSLGVKRNYTNKKNGKASWDWFRVIYYTQFETNIYDNQNLKVDGEVRIISENKKIFSYVQANHVEEIKAPEEETAIMFEPVEEESSETNESEDDDIIW